MWRKLCDKSAADLKNRAIIVLEDVLRIWLPEDNCPQAAKAVLYCFILCCISCNELNNTAEIIIILARLCFFLSGIKLLLKF